MSQQLLNKIESKFTSKKVPDIQPGQTVEIETIIRDGEKQRIQKFKGLVIMVKGSGTGKTFTVRKVSYGVGVEKTFPLYSTNLGKIKIIKQEPVRRAKLYFMRQRVGKGATRIKKGKVVFVPEEGEAVELTEADVVIDTPVEEVSQTEAESV
ncbi:MAG: 50S ribosomal protein L19 [Candidatus Dojkabacteria bacterium]